MQSGPLASYRRLVSRAHLNNRPRARIIRPSESVGRVQLSRQRLVCERKDSRGSHSFFQLSKERFFAAEPFSRLLEATLPSLSYVDERVWGNDETLSRNRRSISRENESLSLSLSLKRGPLSRKFGA